MIDRALFHPRSYPFSIGLLGFSIASLILFHLLFWSPLKIRMAGKEAQWQAARPRVSRMAQFEKAQMDLKAFWALLPERDRFPMISASLSELARGHRLSIPGINYQSEKVSGQDLTRIAFSFSVQGSYQDIRSFILAVERSDDFLIIEDLNLLKAGKDYNDPIHLQLRMGVYLRPAG
jgi:Tfp pilus assembly protein PilO